MTTFFDYRPKNGLRQPRIVYEIDDPNMAILEELRRLGGLRHMNALYLDALKIGAGIMLSRARGEASSEFPAGARLNVSPVSEPAHGVVPEQSGLVPVSSPAVAPSPAAIAGMSFESVQQQPGDDLKASVVVPVLAEPRIVRAQSSAAALAQFKRFGDG